MNSQAASKPSGAWSRWPIVLAYTVALAGAGWNAERHPEWNFDAVGYVAAALSAVEPDPVFLHIRTYGALALAAGEGVYEDMAGGTPFRRELGTSPTALATQIPFYSNKPGYVLALRLFSSSDEDIVHTTHRLAIVGYVVMGVLAFAWLGRLVPLPAAAALSLLMLLSPPFVTTARLSTPDMPGAALLSFASFLAIELELVWAASAVFALACAVRPDALIAVIPLLAWVALTRSRAGFGASKPALIGMAASVVTAAILASRGHPWGVVLKHTFVERLYVPERMSERISTAAYFRAFTQGFLRKNSLDWTVIPLEGVISILALTLQKQRTLAWDSWPGVLAVAWATLVAHYFAFPMLADRFFLHSYFLITVAAAGIVGNRPTSELEPARAAS